MKPFIIGIAGGTGAGKTTLVTTIQNAIDKRYITVISHDDYYRSQSHLQMSERVKTNYDHPDSLETGLLIEHLEQLANGQPISKPVYDFVEHTRSEQVSSIKPTRIIIVEGILLFTDELVRNCFDLKLFVDTEADLRFIRRLQRDTTERGRSVESVVTQYLETVRPMHIQFVEPSKRFADVIIPAGGDADKAVHMIVATIEKQL